MDTPALLGIIFYLIATVYCEEQSVEIEEDCEMLYPEFIKLEDISSQDYPYQIDGNIPVFRKRSSYTHMNDYTVAVFYDDEEDIEAVYVLVDHYVHGDIVTHYFYWEQEISVDSIISRSGSRKLKSIKCQIHQVEIKAFSCMPIEKIMKYTHNKDENIIKTWEGTEIDPFEIYLNNVMIRFAILKNGDLATGQGLPMENLDTFFEYATGNALPPETITNAVNNIKRAYDSNYLPFTEFCSPARELIDQIDNEIWDIGLMTRRYTSLFVYEIVEPLHLIIAKNVLYGYGVPIEEIVGALTKRDLGRKFDRAVEEMTDSKFKSFGETVLPRYESFMKSYPIVRIEVEISHLCETGW